MATATCTSLPTRRWEHKHKSYRRPHAFIEFNFSLRCLHKIRTQQSLDVWSLVVITRNRLRPTNLSLVLVEKCIPDYCLPLYLLGKAMGDKQNNGKNERGKRTENRTELKRLNESPATNWTSSYRRRRSPRQTESTEICVEMKRTQERLTRLGRRLLPITITHWFV